MLNLSYNDIANWEDLCLVDDPENPGQKIESPWNLTMGIYMIHIGIGKLTEKNAAEFYVRAKIVDACFDGGLMRGPRGQVLGITPERVHDYIGLGSNVSTYTEAQFYSHLRKDVVRSLREHYRAKTKDLAAPVT